VIKERVQERLAGFERREVVGLVVVAVLVVGGAALWYARSLPSRVQVTTVSAGPGGTASGPDPTAAPSPPAQEIVVDVAGWVHRPGVYRLHQGDRIIDAIERAGGARSGADLTSLNLAALLSDGEQILVGRAGAPGAGVASGTTVGSSGGGMSGEGDLINLNTATLDELESLSGIGEVLAQRILDYREQHGPFRSVEDLLSVSGIGDKRLADLKPHITV
jgi:competence protein ComEA